MLNKSWRQNPTRYRLYGHLPPITKTIKFRRTRHAGHCWRSKDELISDVLLWTPTYGREKAGRPARTYIQQLCEDTGCSPEDLPEAINEREKWRERVRDIRAGGTTWWWWWWWLLYILWDDCPIFMISGSNEQLQQQLEYTLLKPDCHSRRLSKMQSGREEERYAIKFYFKLGKNAMRCKLDLLLWPRDQETEFPVEACWLSQTQEGQIEQIHPQTFDDPFFFFFDSTGMIYMHWFPNRQTVNKEYYVEV